MVRRHVGPLLRPLTLACVVGSFLLVAVIGCSNAPTPGEISAKDLEKELAEAGADQDVPEKTQLRFGFIKLTDCAPLVIAKEKGFLEDEGLDVELEAQANWKLVTDRVISGELDGSHMLAGQPIGATVGFGTKAHVITAISLDLNGNGITLSKRTWDAITEKTPELATDKPPHPIKADVLKPVVESYQQEGKAFNLGMVFPLSTHNYELRYWLAAGGIHPGMYTTDDTRGTVDGDVVISVTPPPQMPATLEAGTIEGYCVGEPWNQQAVAKEIGVSVITDYEIWKDNPEKVFGVTKEWNDRYPNTHVAVVRAIIRACQWLDAKDQDGQFLNREEACDILARPNYVGADADIIKNSMTGTWMYQKSDVVSLPEFNIFFDKFATYPFYSDCIWYLTQMRRWGQITEPKPADWYHETAKEIYRPDIYLKAANSLVEEGVIPSDSIPSGTEGYREPTSKFIDGVTFDGRKPIEYLASFSIGNQD